MMIYFINLNNKKNQKMLPKLQILRIIFYQKLTLIIKNNFQVYFLNHIRIKKIIKFKNLINNYLMKLKILNQKIFKKIKFIILLFKKYILKQKKNNK